MNDSTVTEIGSFDQVSAKDSTLFGLAVYERIDKTLPLPEEKNLSNVQLNHDRSPRVQYEVDFDENIDLDEDPDFMPLWGRGEGECDNEDLVLEGSDKLESFLHPEEVRRELREKKGKDDPIPRQARMKTPESTPSIAALLMVKQDTDDVDTNSCGDHFGAKEELRLEEFASLVEQKDHLGNPSKNAIKLALSGMRLRPSSNEWTPVKVNMEEFKLSNIEESKRPKVTVSLDFDSVNHASATGENYKFNTTIHPNPTNERTITKNDGIRNILDDYSSLTSYTTKNMCLASTKNGKGNIWLVLPGRQEKTSGTMEGSNGEEIKLRNRSWTYRYFEEIAKNVRH